jgi:hypothetical protein
MGYQMKRDTYGADWIGVPAWRSARIRVVWILALGCIELIAGLLWPRFLAWTILLMLFQSGGVLVFVWQEQQVISKFQHAERLWWRCIGIVALGLGIFALAQWPPFTNIVLALKDALKANRGVIVPPTGSPPPDDFKTYFGWILTATSLIIGFVATLLYGIAKDAKIQIAELNETLARHDIAQNSYSKRIELILESFSLVEEVGKKAKVDFKLSAMKRALIIIPAFCSSMQKLQEDIIYCDKGLNDLERNYLSLQAAIAVISDPRFFRFMHEKFVPYLESLHAQLSKSEMAHHTRGQACISELEKIWQLARTYHG